MPGLIDLWRAVDPEARLVSGSREALGLSVRGVLRTRAAAPHLPARLDGELLVVDAGLLLAGLDRFVAALREVELRPCGLLVAGFEAAALEPLTDEMPVLASLLAAGILAERSVAYLDDELGALGRFSAELRLAAAEAALADPTAAAPAGLVAARIRRGVAVGVDGELRSLNPRPAGRALAARFAALHARLLVAAAATSPRRADPQRTADGLFLLEHAVRPGASVWLFDDLPFARIDQVAAESLGITLRALLRRPPPDATRSAARLGARREPQAIPAAAPGGDAVTLTLLAVARANGRVATAARALGVHRNTVLYRLRAARAERGVDPRRPEDALRLLAEAAGRPVA